MKSGKNTHSMIINNGHGEEGVILFRERSLRRQGGKNKNKNNRLLYGCNKIVN